MKIIKLEEISKFSIDETKQIFNDVVVLPTETVYGIAAKIDSETTIKKIFEVKGRPSDNPLIIHISSIKMLHTLISGEIPIEYKLLMDKFWPGSLSLLFKSKKFISKSVRGQTMDTIVVRMPKNKILREIIDKIGVPLAMPSANTSGRPSPTKINHVIDDLGDKVPIYIDGGECEAGLESTIFGIVESKYILFRPGCITKEQLEKTIGSEIIIKKDFSKTSEIICPGMKYKHYSPSNPLYLFRGSNWLDNMIKVRNQLPDSRIGLLRHSSEHYNELSYDFVYELGSDYKENARNIFSGIRYLDKICDAIFIQEFDTKDEGLAIMDRIFKAAAFIID